MRSELERERIVLIAEGIPGTLTRAGGRRTGTIGSVAITQQRLAIYGLTEPLVDVTWDSGDARDLDVTAEEKGLRVAFAEARGDDDADTPARSELLLHIGDAAALVAAIEQRRRPLEPRRRIDR